MQKNISYTQILRYLSLDKNTKCMVLWDTVYTLPMLLSVSSSMLMAKIFWSNIYDILHGSEA